MAKVKDDNPQGIVLTPKARVIAMVKLPLLIAAFAVGLAVSAYIAVMTSGGKEQAAQTGRPVAVEQPARQLGADGAEKALGLNRSQSGLIGSQPGADSAASAPAAGGSAPDSLPGGPRVTTVLIPPRENPLDEGILREQEEIMRMRAESLKSAIRSPLKTGVSVQVAVTVSAPASSSAAAGVFSPAYAGAESMRDEMTAHLRGEYSPELQTRLAAAGAEEGSAGLGGGVDFFGSGQGGQSTGRATDTSWQLGFKRQAGQKYELKTGAVIPGVLISAINSDLAGSLIAQVSQHVYDSTTGKYLLIPQGSRLYGDYASDVRFGQERLFVSWKRVIFPDGSSITLGDMRGSDQAGQSGFNDDVNNHYLKIFGSSILMSFITGGTTYAVDNFNNRSSDENASVQSEMSVALAQQLGQAGMALMQKNLNISPTLEIRSGYRFSIIATKDVVFSEPYAPMQPASAPR
jgi:type IV secretion system protein VirB10